MVIFGRYSRKNSIAEKFQFSLLNCIMIEKEENKMKMITAIIEERDGDRTIKALNKEGFYCTKLAATGGFLKKSNLTILIGCEDEAVNSAIEIIKREAGRRCEDRLYVSGHGNVKGAPPTIPTVVGGCTLFVTDVLQFVKA